MCPTGIPCFPQEWGSRGKRCCVGQCSSHMCCSVSIGHALWAQCVTVPDAFGCVESLYVTQSVWLQSARQLSSTRGHNTFQNGTWQHDGQATPAMQVATQALPHVSSCWTCRKCRLSPGSDLPSTPEMDPRLVLTRNPLSPDPRDMVDRRQLRNCTECWGCTTQLHRMPSVTVAGITTPPDVGMSSTQVFLAGKSKLQAWELAMSRAACYCGTRDIAIPA
jgi:hypothetical protein